MSYENVMSSSDLNLDLAPETASLESIREFSVKAKPLSEGNQSAAVKKASEQLEQAFVIYDRELSDIPTETTGEQAGVIVHVADILETLIRRRARGLLENMKQDKNLREVAKTGLV